MESGVNMLKKQQENAPKGKGSGLPLLQFKLCFVYVVVVGGMSMQKAFLIVRSGRLVEVRCQRLRQEDEGLLIHLVITTQVKPPP